MKHGGPYKPSGIAVPVHMELHVSVVKLIGAIQGISHTLEEKDKILNMLPLLDFYNDDLLRNINKIRGQQD